MPLEDQNHNVSVRLGTLIERTTTTDRIDLSVDYSDLSKQLMRLESREFGSPVELIDNVVDLAMENEGVWKVSMAVNLSKGARTAKNFKWERNTSPCHRWMEAQFWGDWGPIIIGIESSRMNNETNSQYRLDMDVEKFRLHRVFNPWLPGQIRLDHRRAAFSLHDTNKSGNIWKPTPIYWDNR